MMTAPTRTPIPEMLVRRDAEAGEWSIGDCEPVRGLPHTNIVERRMVVPHDDDPKARVIRAHEMMHAKVSPVQGVDPWVARGIASARGLIVVEEARVNVLAEKAGFDVRKHLSDGSEKASGERVATAGDWAAAVYTAVGYANSAGLNPYITGVRRVNPEWADALRAVATKVVKELKKAKHLAATNGDYRTGLAPKGFLHTERIAEMVDRIANPPQPEPEPDEDQPAGEGNRTRQANEDELGNEQPSPGTDPTGNPTPKPPVDAEDLKNIKPADNGRGETPHWPTLNHGRLPLGRRAPGGLGRSRRASATGRNPRRMHRLLADPERRVFDVKRKGNGGVVLIDGSNSVRFSNHDITRILEAAPGATVAVYSTNNYSEDPNFWILADKGKMSTEIPQRCGGNGVDYPALMWAVGARQHSTAPVVWITDGEVHPPNTVHCSRGAADVQCLMASVRNDVYLRPTVNSAVDLLGDLARGRRVRKWWPRHWRHLYHQTQGKALRSIDLPSR